MALISGALHDALLDAGASRIKAQEAAEEAAINMKRLAHLDGQIVLLKWMAGSATALAFVCFLLLLKMAPLVR
jgi:hypothetical protein